MLDENLPAYILKPSQNGLKHHRELYLTYQGNDPEPAYSLRGVDPQSSSPAHKNCYAAAIFDAYNQDVLFGEVLARPGWTQPSLSAEEQRRNGGVPTPPQPISPTEFTVQLYNPEQQVKVEVKEGKWAASDSYEFSIPQSTFRTPSVSNIDRAQSDPTSLDVTPKLNFVWRKDSKLSKDLSCFMVGKSTDLVDRRKGRKDPDIAIALWRSMRELTIYEPNLTRLDMEDVKGLEIVLILSAVVIRDLFFDSHISMKELFNMHDLPSERKLSGGGRKSSNPQQTYSWIGPPSGLNPAPSLPPRRSYDIQRDTLPRLQTSPSQNSPPPPMADPRSQWELEAETARLRAQAEAEAREMARQRRERERADEAERKRLKKMVEEEEKERKRRQIEVDKETERLRRMYGTEPTRDSPSLPPPGQSVPTISFPPQQPPPQQGYLGGGGGGNLYMQPAASGSSLLMSGANPAPHKKKSFFSLRGGAEETQQRQKLQKKPSALW